MVVREPFRVGEWEVLPLEGRIVSQDRSERLRPKAMDVLCLLASRPGEVVERDTLLGEIWGRTAVTDEPLTATVGELRRLLGDRRGAPIYIETIPKRGYRLVADVERVGQSELPAAAGDAGEALREVGRPHGNPRLAVAALAIALALFVAAGIWFAVGNPPDEVPDSIAVLPFATTGATEQDRYFGDGLAQEVLTMLTGIEGLRVAARNSAFEFRDRRGDLGALRETLRVDAVLDGSIRLQDERVRIQVQLIDTRRGYNLWAETYDRRLGDTLTLQTEIARAIADQLRVAFVDHGRAGAHSGTGDSEAYLAYLRGRYHYEISRDPEGLAIARRHLEEAIDRDPELALARSALAGVWVRFGDYGYVTPAEAYERGREQAGMALKLSPELAEAHLMLGWVRMYHDWDWDGARVSLTRALDLAPGDAFVIAANAALNYHLGQLESAVKLAEMGVARDPLRTAGHYNLAYFRYAAADFDGASRALDQAEALVPDYPRLGLLRAQIDLERGDVDLAGTRVETHPLLALMTDALVANARGDHPAAVDAVHAMERDHAETSPYQIAGVYAQMGRVDEAFRWLETAYALRDPGMADLKVDRLLMPLRDDPRFRVLLIKMGFAEPG